MKLRKLVSILGLTAALSLAAACGQNEGSTEQNQESAETEENSGAIETAPEDTEGTEEAAGEEAAAQVGAWVLWLLASRGGGYASNPGAAGDVGPPARPWAVQ